MNEASDVAKLFNLKLQAVSALYDRHNRGVGHTVIECGSLEVVCYDDSMFVIEPNREHQDYPEDPFDLKDVERTYHVSQELVKRGWTEYRPGV